MDELQTERQGPRIEGRFEAGWAASVDKTGLNDWRRTRGKPVTQFGARVWLRARV